jgi:Flp pilus assembly protein TadD
MINYLARKFDQALAIVEHAKEVNPEHFLPHLRSGYVLVQLKRYDEAIQALKTAVALAERSTETLAGLGMANAAAGNVDEAQAILTELERPTGAKRYVMPYNLAKIYAVSGNAEKAFEWLETAYKEGNPDLIELNSEPIFDGLRSDERFRDLMGRVGWTV